MTCGLHLSAATTQMHDNLQVILAFKKKSPFLALLEQSKHPCISFSLDAEKSCCSKVVFFFFFLFSQLALGFQMLRTGSFVSLGFAARGPSATLHPGTTSSLGTSVPHSYGHQWSSSFHSMAVMQENSISAMGNVQRSGISFAEYPSDMGHKDSQAPGSAGAVFSPTPMLRFSQTDFSRFFLPSQLICLGMDKYYSKEALYT